MRARLRTGITPATAKENRCREEGERQRQMRCNPRSLGRAWAGRLVLALLVQCVRNRYMARLVRAGLTSRPPTILPDSDYCEDVRWPWCVLRLPLPVNATLLLVFFQLVCVEWSMLSSATDSLVNCPPPSSVQLQPPSLDSLVPVTR